MSENLSNCDYTDNCTLQSSDALQDGRPSRIIKTPPLSYFEPTHPIGVLKDLLQESCKKFKDLSCKNSDLFDKCFGRRYWDAFDF